MVDTIIPALRFLEEYLSKENIILGTMSLSTVMATTYINVQSDFSSWSHRVIDCISLPRVLNRLPQQRRSLLKGQSIEKYEAFKNPRCDLTWCHFYHTPGIKSQKLLDESEDQWEKAESCKLPYNYSWKGVSWVHLGYTVFGWRWLDSVGTFQELFSQASRSKRGKWKFAQRTFVASGFFRPV